MSFKLRFIFAIVFMLSVPSYLSLTKADVEDGRVKGKREDEGQDENAQQQQPEPDEGQDENVQEQQSEPDQDQSESKTEGETEVNSTVSGENATATATVPHNATEMDKGKLRDLMFNKERRTLQETGYINRKQLEKECEAAKPCYSSGLVVPVCGSDGRTYANPGVFQCAQKCIEQGNEGLKVKHFGPCPGFVMPPTTSTTPQTTVRTTPKHITGEDRIQFRGFITKVFKWVGMHVHDDGGVYLNDEKENDS